MKKVFSVGCIFILILMNPLLATAKEWYEGGTLHSANVDGWRSADGFDKLATASDWVGSRPKAQEKIKKSDDALVTLHRFSNRVVKCVDRAAHEEGFGNNTVRGLAEGCMSLMGW